MKYGYEEKESNEFKGTRTCKKYRDLSDGIELTKEIGVAYQRKVAHAQIIKGVAEGDFSLDELPELIDQGIASTYSLNATNEAKKKIESSQLYRYLTSEDLSQLQFSPAKMAVDCLNGTFVNFSPEAIRVDEKRKTVEAIWYRSGSPDLNEKTGLTPKNHEKMQQWFNVWLCKRYAKQTAEQVFRLKPGDKFTAIGSHYFMKKSTDKDGQIFDNDFFSGDGGNVVSLTEEFFYDVDSALSKEEETIHKFMEECETGVDELDGLCNSCDMKSQCKYVQPPKLEDVKKIKKLATKKEYNNEQLMVINHREGACVVNARPGSGKTACVVARTASLIDEGEDPKTILHLSFTNNAVAELKMRLLNELISRGVKIKFEDLRCFTNNAFANEAIKEFYEELGYESAPDLLPEDEELQIIEDLLNETPVQSISAHLVQYAKTASTPVMILICQAAFDIIRLLRIDVEGADAENQLGRALAAKGYSSKCGPGAMTSLINLYKKNSEILKKRCLLTYADQEPLMFKVLELHPEYFEELGYKHIIVDEFQDSNMLQAETIKQLINTEAYKSLLLVGDISQSIYKFRGTTSDIMLGIDKILGVDIRKINLLTNYRSTDEICKLANVIDSKNDNHPVPMKGFRKSEERSVVVKGFYKNKEALKEDTWIIDEIKRKIYIEGENPNSICVMSYKKADLTAIAASLTEAKIPWVSKNPIDLMEDSKVVGALALADAFYEPEATMHYFNYLVAKYSGRMFECRSKEQIMNEVNELKEMFLNLEYEDVDFDSQREIFHELLEELRKEEKDELFDYFLELLYKKKDFPSELAYTRTFKKYGSKMTKKMEQNYEGVSLVTCHSAKGLEWPILYLKLSSFDSEALHNKKRKDELEERRRVLYVAITRAMNELYITGNYVAFGKKGEYTYNQFLREVFDSLDRTKEYVPVDPMEEIREKKRAELRKKKDSERREAKRKEKEALQALEIVSNSEKPTRGTRALTQKEKNEYDAQVKNAKQISLFDIKKSS